MTLKPHDPAQQLPAHVMEAVKPGRVAGFQVDAIADADIAMTLNSMGMRKFWAPHDTNID
jgi:hypothetical protein